VGGWRPRGWTGSAMSGVGIEGEAVNKLNLTTRMPVYWHILINMTDNEDPAPTKRPNPWIEFQARVKSITQLTAGVREFSSYLRSKKAYSEWSDAEIVREGLQWVRDEPLFDACWGGDLETVKKLAVGGANITVCDKDGFNLISYTANGDDNVTLVDWLLNQGVSCGMNDLLHLACAKGHIGLGNLAITRGGNIHMRTHSGNTLLMLACDEGHIPFVKLLIGKGVVVNACREGTKATALHVAVSRNNIELAKILLDAGADVCKKYITGATPLDKAIELFKLRKTCNLGVAPAIEMIDLLLSAGAVPAKETMPDELTGAVASPLTHTAAVLARIETVNKAQADAENAKAEEARVRAEEAVKVTEADTTVVAVEARIVELKRRLAEEETLLIAAKETVEKVRASAEAAISSAVARTSTATATVESVLSSMMSPQTSPDSDNSINHVVDEVTEREPIYERRKKIPKRIRTLVWNKYVGEDTPRAKCFCCRDTTISFSAFDCGHVIAESKGGDLTINNLRPVCHECNLAMGTRSMNDFTTEFFGWTV
jgi:ankyrin repeat protein